MNVLNKVTQARNIRSRLPTVVFAGFVMLLVVGMAIAAPLSAGVVSGTDNATVANETTSNTTDTLPGNDSRTDYNTTANESAPTAEQTNESGVSNPTASGDTTTASGDTTTASGDESENTTGDTNQTENTAGDTGSESDTSGGQTYMVQVSAATMPDMADVSTNQYRQASKNAKQPVANAVAGIDGASVQGYLWIANTLVVDTDSEAAANAVTNLVERNDVVSVEEPAAGDQPQPPDAPEQPVTGYSSTDGVGYTWGLQKTNVPEAWEQFGVTGNGAKVAIPDTGVNISHPAIELGGDPTKNYKGGWAVFNDSTESDTNDAVLGTFSDYEGTALDVEPKYSRVIGFGTDTVYYHGTHVSGIATGGVADDPTHGGKKHIGVAPNATLQHALVQDFFGPSGTGTTRTMQWAVNTNADVVTMSLDLTNRSYLQTGAENARAAGVLLIGSAGNDGVGTSSLPAAYGSVMPVGSIDPDGSVSSFSAGETFDPTDRYGETMGSGMENPQRVPFVVAPGASVPSADAVAGEGMYIESGTSMSAPHVAGIVALMKENNPDLTPDEIKKGLRVGAIQPDAYAGGGWNNRSGYGVVNATNSLRITSPNYITVSDASVTQTVTEGNPVTISANLTNPNVLGETATQTVDITANGSVVAQESVTLNAEQTTNHSFTYETTQSDVGNTDFGIATGNDSGAATASVEPKAQLSVSLDTSSVNATFVESQTETLDVTVTNTGGQAGSAIVEFAVNGSNTQQTVSNTLTVGESQQLSFSHTPAGTRPATNLTVQTASDTETIIRPTKSIDTIDITPTTPSSVDQNGSVSLAATYSIDTGVDRTITPVIKQDGTTIHTLQQTTLDADGQASVDISVTDSLPLSLTGTTQYTFTTTNGYNTDESATRTVSINSQPIYTVGSYTTDFANEEIQVTLDNKGGQDGGDRTIDLTQDGTNIGSATTGTIAAGATKTITIPITVTSNSRGTLGIETPHRTATYQETFAKPEFSVDIDEGSVGNGIPNVSDTDIPITVTNTGGVTDSTTVEVLVNGTVKNTLSMTLQPGETNEFVFTHTPAGRSAVNVTAVAGAVDDSLIRPIEKVEPLAIDASTPATLDEGDSIEVSATYNVTDGLDRTITPTIKRDGTTVYTGQQTVLSPGNSPAETQVTYTNNLDGGVSGTVEYNITAQTEYNTDEAVTKTVTIDPRPVYAITDTSYNSEDESVDITVENNGSVDASDAYVTVKNDGTMVGNATNITIPSGSAKTVTINASDAAGSTGTTTVLTPQTSASYNNLLYDGGGGGGGGGGVGGGGVGGGSSSGPPSPTQTESTVELMQPEITTTLTDESGGSSESSAASGDATVADVTFENTDTQPVEVTEYGEPPETVETEVVNSIADDTEAIEAATETAADESASDGDSDSTASGETSGGSVTVEVVEVAQIEPKQDISDAATAEVAFSVDREKVSNPDDLTVYKDAYVFEAQKEQWVEAETTVESVSEETVELSATVEEFSMFAVMEIDDGSASSMSETPATNQTDQSDDGQTDNGIPGFGVGVALAAVILLSVIIRGTRSP